MPLYANLSEESSAPTGSTAQAQIPIGPYKHDAFVLTTAHGSSQYVGPKANAGIVLTLNADGHVVQDDAFEGESSSISFRSAASHNFILDAGKKAVITADIRPQGAGGVKLNRDTVVHLHVIAIGVVVG
ncbi:MAG: hypothetical protein V4574_12760 [Pseudomonadota bacterium]